MRLLRLTLTDFPQLCGAHVAPESADQRAVRSERQRQDQSAGGGVFAGPRPGSARCPQRRFAAAWQQRRMGRRRPVRHGGRRGRYRHRHAYPPTGSHWHARRRPGIAIRRLARRVFRLDGATPRSQGRSPPTPPRYGSRRRWTGCSWKAFPAAAASSIAWSGRWNPAMRGRLPRMMPPWRSAIACSPRAARTRAGWPGWRMRWPGTPWQPRLPALPWSPE